MSSKQIKTVLIGAVLIVAVIGAGYLYNVNLYQRKVRAIEISDVDLSLIPDGIYIGECDVHFIYAKVAVTVRSGRITELNVLEHRNDRGSAAESIVDDIVKKQRIDVDAVAGATNSSMVIEKAVENALSNAS